MQTQAQQTESTTTRSSASEFSIVPQDRLDALLKSAPVVRMMLENSLREAGDFRPEDVLAQLRGGFLQLWLVYTGMRVDAVVVTKVDIRPLCKVGMIVYCTGEDRERWVHHVETLEDWFREHGCSRVQVWARKGWQRVLKDWQWTHILLEKAI